MGLSSSQARLMNLTARMHQIEYKAAKVEAMKLQMANESSRVYEEYLKALDATKIQAKKINTDGSMTWADWDTLSATEKNALGLTLNKPDGAPADWPLPAITDCDAAKLARLLEAGYYLTCSDQKQADSAGKTSVATNTNLQEVSDETKLKKAEAKYEADMRAIDQKDRKYDTDLAALDTERNAIKQEMDTLKTVAKDNVERTFKLFS